MTAPSPRPASARTARDEFRISVVVPAYNAEEHVVAAIDSLVGQTERFFEIILVDDGSTDGTAALLGRYRDVAGVKILRTANRGQGAARNAGLARASGDYVYFFDSDDLLEPDFVESMRAAARRRPDADIFYFSGESFWDPDCRVEYEQSYDRKDDAEYPSGVAATGAMLRRDVYFAMPCMYLSKKSLWDARSLAFQDIVHEDEELLLPLSCSAGVSLCLSKVFYRRRIRSGSTMTRPKSELNAIGYLRTLESIAAYCAANRALVAPILPELTGRFYGILRGYLAVCKAIRRRPDYKRLLRLALGLGRFPAARQLYEIGLPPAFRARVSRVKRRFDR